MSTAIEHQGIDTSPSLAHSTVSHGTGMSGKVTHNVVYVALCFHIDILCYITPYVLLSSTVLFWEGKYSNTIRKSSIIIDVNMYIFSTTGGTNREYVGWFRGYKHQNGTDW